MGQSCTNCYFPRHDERNELITKVNTEGEELKIQSIYGIFLFQSLLHYIIL